MNVSLKELFDIAAEERRLASQPKLVIVHVEGGVAEVVEVPEGVTLRIVDYDNDRSGETYDEIVGPAGPVD